MQQNLNVADISSNEKIKPADLTAIILTLNEEKNIVDCIHSLQGFAKRIVVVDSGSNDRTIEIAQSMGAEVYFNEFTTHANQWNWALDNTEVTTLWTLRFDADERLTPPLIAELRQLLTEHAQTDTNGITMEAWLYFLGRRLKHGGPQKRKLMVFKTGLARVEDREIDEHTYLLSGYSIATKEKFIHDDFKDLTFFIDKLNWYATREVNDYFNYLEQEQNAVIDDEVIANIRQKKYGVYYKLPMFIRSWMLFIFNYIFRLGFLDGKEGFIYHYMYQRWYRTLIDAKIFERQLDEKK